jgi:ABC-type nitrate/sulfonate/bicarbonate transport system permease component
MSVASRARDIAFSLVLPVALVALWWVLSAGSKSVFYPPLDTILGTFRSTWLFADVGREVVPSLGRLMAGYVLAIVLGVGLGVLFGRVQLLDRAFQPTVQFARSIPATGLVPISIALLGIGDAAKIWLIAFVCVFPILLNTIDGVRGIEPGLEDVGATFRLSRRQRIIGIQLPSASPKIFAGMRISLAIAFIMMIVSEMVGARNGIGYVTLNAQQSFEIPLMWSGMILLGILGTALNFFFLVIERRVLSWHYRSTGRSS